jgi:hypothetical protein
MLLSVPLTMTAKIAMDDFEETRWLAVLLSGGDGEQQEAEREESRDDAQQTSLEKSDSSTS